MGNVIRGSMGNANNNTSNDNRPTVIKEVDALMAIQDYPCSDVSEPIFKMGEKLSIISQEARWWKVRSSRTGKENFIPHSHVAKVYHGWLFEGVIRQKAEELLLMPGNRVGSFLVRESTSARGVYSLSVKHRQIKHYRIFRLDNSWYYISPRLTFQCLEDMINHYSDAADGLCCVLTSPCLSGTFPTLHSTMHTPPVTMRRRDFDWRNVDSRQLIGSENPDGTGSSDNMVSYGVRNSMATYMSLSETETAARNSSRKKKSRSICAIPDSLDYHDQFD